MNEIIHVEPSVVICGEQAHACYCSKQPDHDGPHHCGCGGKWFGTFEGPDFKVVSFPSGLFA